MMPWTTFTDPELAHAGLTTAAAIERFGADHVRVHRWSLDHNDRAHTDGSSGAMVLVEHRRRRAPGSSARTCWPPMPGS